MKIFRPFRAALALACAAVPLARAYNLIGTSWPSGNIALRLHLDATARTAATSLTDGSASWNAVAQSALTDWNTRLARSQLTSTTSTAQVPATADGDGVSQVFFANTIYGETFGSGVLAVTLVNEVVRTTETDLVVNRTITWNSYRGDLRNSPVDLRRTLLHELGHVLGLDHPDQSNSSANPAITTSVQNVPAIMNAFLSNTETLQPDDLAGVDFLYHTPFSRLTITTQPRSLATTVGAAISLPVGLNGLATPPAPDAFHGYLWYFKAVGATAFEPLFTINTPGSLTYGTVQATDAGSYYFEAVTPDDVATSDTVTLTVSPVATTAETQLANLSTRGLAGSGSSSMIVGFTVSGGAKTVLLRAIGPTLAGFGVAGTLADPILTLKNSSGATVATNDNWEQAANLAELRATSARVGAFALAAGSRDSALLVTLPAGGYTAIVSSPDSASGVALVEAYDADSPRSSAARLSNLSSRGFVGLGGNILIAGFTVAGPGPRTYLIRLVGDTLASLGVTGTLEDPYQKLYRSDGTLLREIDDFDSPLALQPTLKAAFAKVGAFALTDRQENALLVTLFPGGYSVQASGLDNGHGPTGVALVEVYEMPEP